MLGGLLGVGGGFIMVPLQVLAGRQDQHRANGTSLAAVIPIAAVASLVYYLGATHPLVDFRFAALLVLGGIIGAYVGARTAARLPERRLKMGLAALLLVVALKEIVRP